MLQHPLDSASTPSTPDYSENYSDYPPLTDDDLSGFARRVSAVCHQNDNIVRASSPFGRRYLKPINGIQTKGFAKSAQRRSSVMTLGSIERLQNFYAKRDLKVNKTGALGFNKALTEEPEDLDSLPTPQEPPPSWIDLDVETDLDVLLSQCFKDIQGTLTTWAMVTGPNLSTSSSSSQPTESESESEGSFQILPLLQSVTTMLHSVRNYIFHRDDLTDNALSKLRHASLDLLESMRELENQHRLEEEEAEEDGFLYKASDFKLLENERQSIHHYLEVVESYAFNPPHHIGSPPALFTPEIKALMGKTGILSLSEDETDKALSHTHIPVWLERGSFADDPLGRYRALLMDNQEDKYVLPDPNENEEDFLQSIADGIILCNAYNGIVRKSRRPFGFISKIHKDSKRTYRAIENLRFFSAACKFRFELVFPEFDPSDIARKTDKGLHMLKKVISLFCECVIHELREELDHTH